MATEADAPDGRRARTLLPLPMTSFVGLEAELAEARALLGERRLLTLTGFGGIGKSRLAGVLVRSVVEEWPDGVVMVDLQVLPKGYDVAEAVGDSLKVAVLGPDLTQALVDFVADRRMLLVLDNCEHLLDSARVLVERLLAGAPGLTVLATSREPLGLPGEQERAVPPLPLAQGPVPVAEVAAQPALRLLVERARADDPRFALGPDDIDEALQVCRRLDGLPLAIELAAARLRVLSVGELRRGLDDRFALLRRGPASAVPQHRSLLAMVEWSYQLCTPQEQQLWRRLAVFSGGADLAGVVAVCGADVERDQLIDGLHALVQKSVLRAEPGTTGLRYRMYETLQEFGLARLADDPERAAALDRHSRHFQELGRRLEAEFIGPEQRRWFAVLRDERYNLLAAVDRLSAEGRDDGRPALALVSALRMYYLISSHRLVLGWLRGVLAAAPTPSPERALALCSLTLILRSPAVLEEAAQIAREMPSPELDMIVMVTRSR